MSRFKHRLKEPFGKAGLTVAVLALVMALVGGAYAAGGLSGKQKKEVKAIAKSFQGTGAAGTNGAPGKDGAPGINGTPGTSGINGKSVLAETVSPGVEAECEGLGGSSFHQEGSATKHFACNGEPGQTGFTETLPKGKTETGVWGYSTPHIEAPVTHSTATFEKFSFPIPLKQAPTAHFILPEGEEFVAYHGSAPQSATKSEEEADITIEKQPPGTKCPGSATEPEAAEGNLCVYSLFLNGPVEMFINFFNFSNGAIGEFQSKHEEREEASAVGSWAVTSGE